MDYFLQRNKKNMRNVSKYIENLPPFVVDFFVGIENYTSELTRANYALDLRIFFDYIASYKFQKPSSEITLNDLNAISSSEIEAFLSYTSYYIYNNKTLHNTERGKARKLATLRTFFKYFYNKDKIKENVVSKISTPKQHQKEIIRLEIDEVAKILQEAENPKFLSKTQVSYNKHTKKRDVAILTTFLGTGIRVSELVGLNIQDLDLKNNAFKITRKGGNQVVLYYPQEVKDAIFDYLEERKDIVSNDTALFLSLQKKRITTRAVQNIVKKFAKQISPLKKISPHKLRSTFGTNLYRETKDIYIVADMLGHKDVNTTKKHYAAISEDIRRDVANKIKLR